MNGRGLSVELTYTMKSFVPMTGNCVNLKWTEDFSKEIT